MCSIMGYPETASGNLASGGSIGNLIAIVTARDYKKIEPQIIQESVIYLTSQVHHCVQKAIRIAGLHRAQTTYIPVDENYKMDVNALQEQIKSDIADGKKPFLLIGSAGTTDGGAVDPLNDLADVAEEFNLWFHVDGPYGGFFMLTGQGKAIMKGIERSDSLVIDPHKGLFLSYGLGVVLIKNVQAQKDAHQYQANYMQDALNDTTELSPADLSPELTKHFRGLRMWLPLQIHGLKPFKSALREKILLTKYFREALVAIPNIRIVNEPELTIFAYRYENNSFSKQRNNRINKKLTEEIHKEGKVFLSSTNIDDEICLRIAILSFRTHIYEIELALNEIKTKLESIIKMH